MEAGVEAGAAARVRAELAVSDPEAKARVAIASEPSTAAGMGKSTFSPRRIFELGAESWGGNVYEV